MTEIIAIGCGGGGGGGGGDTQQEVNAGGGGGGGALVNMCYASVTPGTTYSIIVGPGGSGGTGGTYPDFDGFGAIGGYGGDTSIYIYTPPSGFNLFVSFAGGGGGGVGSGTTSYGGNGAPVKNNELITPAFCLAVACGGTSGTTSSTLTGGSGLLNFSR